LPGGSYQILQASIRNRLFTLPDDTIVLPGHHYGPTPHHHSREKLKTRSCKAQVRILWVHRRVARAYILVPARKAVVVARSNTEFVVSAWFERIRQLLNFIQEGSGFSKLLRNHSQPGLPDRRGPEFQAKSGLRTESAPRILLARAQ